jgi:hypothetical protein
MKILYRRSRSRIIKKIGRNNARDVINPIIEFQLMLYWFSQDNGFAMPGLIAMQV